MNVTRRRVWSLRKSSVPSWVPGLALDDILTCVQSEVLAGLFSLTKRMPLRNGCQGGTFVSTKLMTRMNAYFHSNFGLFYFMRIIHALEAKGMLIQRRIGKTYKRGLILSTDLTNFQERAADITDAEIMAAGSITQAKSQDCEDLF